MMLGLPELKRVVIIPYVKCDGGDSAIGSIKNGSVVTWFFKNVIFSTFCYCKILL